MSEYWKSTPKYWCKHCKTYVRDTPFERTQHEATGKHQGNLKRFLRDVHRSQDKDQRESQKAKSEVERLKGLVASPAPGAPPDGKLPPWRRSGGNSGSGASTSMSATKEERKRQMQQLAEMGVAIPEEFRPELAMAGEWKTVSETPIMDHTQRDMSAMAKGVKRRRLDGEGEDEEDVADSAAPEAERPKKVWGSAFKDHPGGGRDDEDLDALLSMTTTNIRGKKTKLEPRLEDEDVKKEEETEEAPIAEPEGSDMTAKIEGDGNIYREELRGGAIDNARLAEAGSVDEPTPPVVFKKRKQKQTKR
ncbi:C2H2-type zinc finger protein [Emydomyces testavorans]|uniref:C2H2-type zinc finger protein n=1 Tax=Emydomyces testavorans TaxID=2070801 RepID=A0AAF0DN34_9EURO|nr:C2H2-type zinc finger protein [Emydomyces testavorans]